MPRRKRSRSSIDERRIFGLLTQTAIILRENICNGSCQHHTTNAFVSVQMTRHTTKPSASGLVTRNSAKLRHEERDVHACSTSV